MDAAPPPEFPRPAIIRPSGIVVPQQPRFIVPDRGTIVPGVPAGLMGKKPRELEFSYINRYTNDANLATYSFSASFGAAHPDRRIIVMTRHNGSSDASRFVTNVSIGGGSATILPYGNQNHGWSVACAIRHVPTGTSGTVSVQYNSGTGLCGIAVWRAVGYEEVYDVGGPDSSGSIDLPLDVPKKGIVVALAGYRSSTSATWSNLTRNFVATIQSGYHFSGASDYFENAVNNLAVSTTATSSHYGLAISFKPMP